LINKSRVTGKAESINLLACWLDVSKGLDTLNKRFFIAEQGGGSILQFVSLFGIFSQFN